jgi:hypothetical protein
VSDPERADGESPPLQGGEDVKRRYQAWCLDCKTTIGDPQRTRASAERVRRRHEHRLGHATGIKVVESEGQ